MFLFLNSVPGDFKTYVVGIEIANKSTWSYVYLNWEIREVFLGVVRLWAIMTTRRQNRASPLHHSQFFLSVRRRQTADRRKTMVWAADGGVVLSEVEGLPTADMNLKSWILNLN